MSVNVALMYGNDFQISRVHFLDSLRADQACFDLRSMN
jgi:hypothetical protein